MYWPDEDLTTAVATDNLLEGEGCEVESNCVIRNLPGHTGKVAALGTYIVHVTVVNTICT